MGEPAAAQGQEPEAAPRWRARCPDARCAVVAMRYAVEDEFAMLYARDVYDGLFRQDRTFPKRPGSPSTKLYPVPVGRGRFDGNFRAFRGEGGGAAAHAAQAAYGQLCSHETGLAFFPPEPEHFVGRVTAMTQASAALAAESKKSGVLFHGMAGAERPVARRSWPFSTSRPDGFRASSGTRPLTGRRHPTGAARHCARDGETAARLGDGSCRRPRRGAQRGCPS